LLFNFLYPPIILGLFRMAKLGPVFRISNSFLYGFRSRINSPQLIYSASYAQSAEYKLGIDKPKKPVTIFLKFASQVRPALKAKNPDIGAPEIMKLASKHWQQLGEDAKKKMYQEYEKEYEEYKKKRDVYEASLTIEQKEDIAKMQEVMTEAKEKKKHKAELKDLGRPKRPMSSYIIFAQTTKEKLKDTAFANYQTAVSKLWTKLSPEERMVYEEKAEELRAKYRIELSIWEQKMLRMGNINLISKKTISAENSNEKPSSKSA